MRLQQRTLTAGMVRNAMETLEIIEAYPQDKYLPSFLLRGESEGSVFHVQIATDGVACQEDQMRCRICAGVLEPRVTDLPFKIGDSSIVILRSLPVLQCRQCGDTELEQATMSRVDQLLAAVDESAELEIIRYAA